MKSRKKGLGLSKRDYKVAMDIRAALGDYWVAGAALGELVQKKNEAYGDSINATGAALRELFPAGIRPEQYGDLGLIVRVWDKLKRIASRKDAFGESPWQDIAGYGLLGSVRDKKAAGRGRA
ncbi:MAG TPA: hypothetical protein PK280_20130 [Planctomycetota bacterium]|nr:hypothetical protein [Planctomycetota bacterium]